MCPVCRAKGEYARRLRAAEPTLSDLTGYRVKIVERGGTTLEQLLVKSNPWAGGQCGRVKCMQCLTLKDGGDSKCSKHNILYQNCAWSALKMEKQQFILENRQDQHMKDVWSILRLIGGRKKHLICGSMFTMNMGGTKV